MQSLGLVLSDLVSNSTKHADRVEVVEHAHESWANLGPAEAILIQFVALGFLVHVREFDLELLDDEAQVDRHNGPMQDDIVACEDGFQEISRRLVVSASATVHQIHPLGQAPNPEQGASSGLNESEEADQLHFTEPRGNLRNHEESIERLLPELQRVEDEPQVATGPTLVQVNIEEEVPDNADELEKRKRKRHGKEVAEPIVLLNVALGRVDILHFRNSVRNANICEVFLDFRGLFTYLVELLLDVVALFFEDALDVVEDFLWLGLFIVLLLGLLLLFLEALQLFLFLLDLLFHAQLILELLLQVGDIVHDRRHLFDLLDCIGQVSAKLRRNLADTFHGTLDEHMRK